MGERTRPRGWAAPPATNFLRKRASAVSHFFGPGGRAEKFALAGRQRQHARVRALPGRERAS